VRRVLRLEALAREAFLVLVEAQLLGERLGGALRFECGTQLDELGSGGFGVLALEAANVAFEVGDVAREERGGGGFLFRFLVAFRLLALECFALGVGAVALVFHH
jgi:hypothetical protein